MLASHPARASLRDAPLEVRSAVGLDPALQAECRAMLARLIGGRPEPDFRTDPTLLAGIELASPNAVIRNSWREDLERITRALQQDTGHDVASPPVG